MVSVKASKTIETSTASVLNKDSECLFNMKAVFHLITSILKAQFSFLRYRGGTLVLLWKKIQIRMISQEPDFCRKVNQHLQEISIPDNDKERFKANADGELASSMYSVHFLH